MVQIQVRNKNGKAKSSLATSGEALSDKLLDFKDDMGKNVQKWGKKAGHKMADWKEDAGEKMEEWKEDAQEKIEKAQDNLEEAGKQVKTYVKKNPVKSSLIAMGVGAALGMIVASIFRPRR